SATPGELGLAFGLVIAAGLCTCVGACIAFCVKVTDIRVLAAALGVSAGVMMYVSFVEIFSTKSIGGFQKAGFSEAHSYRYATLMVMGATAATFFGGMFFTWVLNQVAHAILHISDRCSADKKAVGARLEKPPGQAALVTQQPSATSSVDPSAAPPEQVASQDVELAVELTAASQQVALPGDEQAAFVQQVLKADHHAGLTRMGLLSALAVGIHNFPEGLATFVGTLADPRAGVAIAVAIALHNIPEGIVVALPIYYATGSKWKGFLWSAVCGLAEPLAGLLGWLVLRGRDSDPLMYAVMFAVVAGMMVYISVQELIPTALRYDVDNSYTTRGIFFGMAVMAASLMLFQA
ncbi:Zinc transporter ZupT, partial [Tetrabaena socialis]